MADATKRIIYTNAEGGVSVVVPALEADISIEEVAKRVVPEGVSYEIVDAQDVPSDRSYRNAWARNGRAITHDIVKARAIHKDKIREARKPQLDALDVEFMRATEVDNRTEMNQIASKKQALRDATADPRIDAAQNIEDLKLAWPEALR